MKDLKSRAVSFLAMLALVFTLAGCGIFGGGDKREFLGTWKATADLAETINEEVRNGLAGTGEGLGDYLKVSSFEVTLVYTFNKDNTYSIRVDEDTLKAVIEHAKDELKDGAVVYLEDVIAQSGHDMTVEELMETSGLDLDALADSAFEYDKIGKSFADYFTRTGRWKAENGELYLSESVRRDADELSNLYEITSDGIRLTAPEGSEDEMGIYPLLLQKA